MLIQNPPVELTDRIWMLGMANYPLYLVRGDSEAAIFEGGIGPLGPILRDQFEQLGIGADLVKQLVVTHAHPDHVMAVPALRQMFPNATVLASEPAAKTLAFEKAVSFFSKLDDALTDSLVQHGLVDDQHRRGPLADPTIAVDRTLKEGDTIKVDDISIDVLETPGHSDCSLSFFAPDSKTLIISDATGYYLPDSDYWWPCYFTNYGAYVASMKRLADMDSETLCLSHNAVIKGQEEVKSYFDRAITATELYHHHILDQIEAGKSPQEIAEQLGGDIYERTQRLSPEFFQKNCSLLVKLSTKHAQASEN